MVEKIMKLGLYKNLKSSGFWVVLGFFGRFVFIGIFKPNGSKQ